MISVYEIKYIVSTEGFFFFSQYLYGLEEEFVYSCIYVFCYNALGFSVSKVGNY